MMIVQAPEVDSTDSVTDYRFTDPKALQLFLSNHQSISPEILKGPGRESIRFLRRAKQGRLPIGRLGSHFQTRPVSASVTVTIDCSEPRQHSVEFELLIRAADGFCYSDIEVYGAEFVPTPDQIKAATELIREARAQNPRIDDESSFEGVDGPAIREFAVQ
ncbi:hypothetical protein [Roseiconus lacunae]|uniref:hypothetical protein n=1 Tax=Roseiconus lacunae TaxID=2605694 RepID=UPI001E61E0A8|nr:hypothetical protein [Roseiconus lacunae]MCD0460040.1 hypothetical protein [Roseiconus lacunae]